MGQRGPLPDNVLPGPGAPAAGEGQRRTAHQLVDRHAPNPPTWLDREGKAEWRRVVPQLERAGLLAGALDRGTLTAWCRTWAQYAAVTRSVAAEGERARRDLAEVEEQLRRGDAEGWQDLEHRHRLIERQRALQVVAEAQGTVVLGYRGSLVKNPAMQVQRDLQGQLLALAKELLLTPVGRLRVDLPEGDADEGDSALD